MRGFVQGLVAGWIIVGAFLIGQAHPVHHVTSIPPQEVFVLCQPSVDKWGWSGETTAQFESCVRVATEAWKLGQQ